MEYTMNMNTSLRVAVVMLLGTTMHGAFALDPNDPIKLANEIGKFTSQELEDGAGLSFQIPVIKGKTIKPKTTTSDEPYFVSITLLDGAKFGSVPTLSCNYTVTGAEDALVDSPPATVGGSVATYRLVPGASVSAAADVLDTASCTLTFGSTALILASGQKDYGIRITAAHYDAYEKVSATVVGTLVSFAQGAQASVTQGEVTVDVSTPSLSKQFLSAGTVTANAADQRVAQLGIISYKATEGILGLDGEQVSAASILNKFTLTVSGAALVVAQEVSGGATGAGVYLSWDNCKTAGGFASAFASGSQVSFADVTFSETASETDLSVCMVANEAATIDRGAVSFSISSVVGQGVGASLTTVPNLSIFDTTLVKVTKNGTSLKVLNIPSPDYTIEQAAVRVYNMGTTAGKVTGTLYSQGSTDGSNTNGGTVLGTAGSTLIESLAPNAVKVLTGADIGKVFGQTTWPGKAWLQIESEIKGLRVQALVRTTTANGQVLTNMSDRVMLDGEKVERTE
jgi:hypothetical protein